MGCSDGRGWRNVRRTLQFTALVGLASFSFAQATLAAQTITSTGPLTNIGISDDLNCSVNHTGDLAGEFYGGTACGTLLATGGTLFGPSTIPAGGSASPRTGFSPVSQTAVTGSGAAADPFTVVTVVDLGTSGLRITETDSYVVGEESYRTDVQVSNSASTSQDAILYRAGDCFLQSSDVGFGSVDTTTGAVACTTGTAPGSRIEQWFPISAGSHYYEAGYSQVWAQIGSQQPFPDTCRCTDFIDNGAGLSWNITVPAGGSLTRSQLTTFSPLGRLPLSTSKTADTASVAGGSVDGYTITVSNPNPAAVTLSSITDTLPTGFTYTAGSTTGATMADPSISGQTLTWAGPVTVPAASGSTPGTVSLHFGVTVSSIPGDYFNNAGASSADFTVVPTGDTARITVTGVSDQPITAHGTTVSAVEGAGFSGNVATFDDPDSSATASEYSAVIDWGDGSPTSAGTISGSGGSFTVNGTHTYSEEGTYSITVVITDVDNTSNNDTAHSTANVSDAALASRCAAPATSLAAFTGPTATFTDADPNGTSSDYTATIDWGDSSSSSGTVSSGTGPGPYTVSSSHTYSSTGMFTITTTINDVGGSQTVATCRTLIFAFARDGAFVIGDKNAATGTYVTFWGAQWWKQNSLTGGSAPASFKGFANKPTPPSCGTDWSTTPGNSAPPPIGPLPAHMGVIVSSKVTQSGSKISGNAVHLVVIRTDSGYQPDPGHYGTGTVEAQIC
jgi:uncharacterized repeat protein (TIGR01451 family)